jgi:RHS repeat-associated protein
MIYGKYQCIFPLQNTPIFTKKMHQPILQPLPLLRVYSPFGAVLEGRSWSSESGYRYGFNGMEKDSENFEGAYDFGARILDARLGRWLSVDRCYKLYFSNSVFCFVANSPLRSKDVGGNYIFISTNIQNKETGVFERTWIKVENSSDLTGRNDAMAMLLYTDEGAYEIEKYISDTENDVYLKFEENFQYQPNGDQLAIPAGGVTAFFASGILAEGGFLAERDVPEVIADYQDLREGFKVFDGIKQREGATTTSFMVINNEPSSHGPSRTRKDSLRNKAASIFHEFYAHVTLRINGVNAKDNHTVYGEQSVKDTQPDTCAAEIRDELSRCDDEFIEQSGLN